MDPTIKVGPPDIKDILLKGNYVSAEEIQKGLGWAKTYKSTLEEYLLTQGVITKDILGQAMAEFYQVPYADLNTKVPAREQVLRIPKDVAITYRVVLFSENDTGLTITTDNPPRVKPLQSQLQIRFPSKKISVAYSMSEDIDACFIHYRKPLETRFSEIVAGQTKVAPEIIDEIVADALAFKASDIHFEPQEKEVVVRFRVDGVLHEAGRFSKQVYENILNRIKVQAHLRIDEHFSAQDGAIRFAKEKATVDMRVSVISVLDGEKITIRLLAEYVKGFTFTDLGVSEKDQAAFLTAAKKPFGMILVAGPTGSGKTTTLYALVKMLNQPTVNITTIEDPVEYKILGVNSIQVNPQTNLTFAKGLRSIVRQDPDIILVGEIRDLETAEIAVNAALTGHLLFSSFHANDASSAIPRLLDMGVEPFLMASTLELVIAQRLVRKICDQCRVSFTPNPEQQKISATLYKGKGCNNCGNTGYKGRTAIFEFIEIDNDMEDLILKTPSSKEIWQLAQKNGAHSLFEDGLEKVKNGITTIEELLRVALPPKS
ncbi:Flp pilus assembly complex ATPase component TadA [Candidatus Collierbacteria bacterium]|nr:Flp pilus assembly complex ATPase component TadA [Candidatus Collierbacteria bacterium]